MAPKQTNRPSTQARAVARRYAEEIEASDELGIAVTFGLNNGYRAEMSAMGRFFASLAMARSAAGYTVLRFLYFAHDEAVTQNDIRNELGVSTANVTHLIDVLEKEGLATRSTHPADRRKTVVSLTEDGANLTRKMVPAMVQFMELMTVGFTEAEKRQFLSFIERFHENASRILPATGGD